MSLSALLNDNDEDIIPQTSNPTTSTTSTTPTTLTTLSTSNSTTSNSTTPEEKKSIYLNNLNNKLNQLKLRDHLEWLYQDWKFLNLQEFELINEWNYINLKDIKRNKLLSKDKEVSDDFIKLNNNWKDYLSYKDKRFSNIIDQVKPDSEESIDQDHDSTIDQDTIDEEEEEEEEEEPLENNTEMLEQIDDEQIDDEQMDDEQIDDVQMDDSQIDDDDDDDVQFYDFEDESDKDQDFTIGYQKKRKHKYQMHQSQNNINNHSPQNHIIDYNPKEITIDSERKYIISELKRLYRKHKGQKTKKRRFTNIFIQDIINDPISDENINDQTNDENINDPIKDENINDSIKDENVGDQTNDANINDQTKNDKETLTQKTTGQSLIVKITLKQNHSKKLTRLINDDKRREEKLLQEKLDKEILSSLDSSAKNSPSKKRRKLNPNETSIENGEDENNTSTITTTNISNENNNEVSSNINSNNAPTGNRRKTHDLPTYGIKMSAREARAIQRHYDNTYITIWKDMARRDSNRMLRLYQQIQSIRSTNFKKTSSLCAREARKWQTKNFKQVKDLQTRSRRGIREMSNFWKKNEREEREIKKKTEKIALENAKKEEEERENKRQAKKLNFLLTQTELYSHFIGRKIKTDELEGNDASNTKNIDIDLETTNATKNDFHEIDFDNEDDEQLRLKAAENASNVLAQNKAQAQAFDSKITRNTENEGNEEDDEDEDGELNFQNPTSLGDITLEQPKLMDCTLKEYQLKGLNWLANLYDQGINGILADEMGLGKTVQSISVLAHLAEHYNIWGPFLVVTPASTLHNWVNEITKFVPEFKILPYWGNGNDRKVLRKFWDRKNLRYGKNAPFHVMVTSYQMVVSDVTYLQKMRWQYMILDEAQAIKSSQSSRWRNLLSFHCRNRLLLTGTPIQNNMQELWALLHFIMPSLFDSHDEFSEWFSKDIESHAEGNGQLNQQQVRRLHMILKPFMLRRIKKNVQSELGDKIEIDVLCDLTQRQKKLYQVLRSQLSSNYDDIENAAGSDENSGDQNLLNAVMQFRKVCNHPDLFERADVESPFAFVTFGKTNRINKKSNIGGSNTVNNSSTISMSAINGSLPNGLITSLNYANLTDVIYSSCNPITYRLPRLIYDELLIPHYQNSLATFNKIVNHTMNIYSPTNNKELSSYLNRIAGYNGSEISRIHNDFLINRVIKNKKKHPEPITEFEKSLIVPERYTEITKLAKTTTGGVLESLLNIQGQYYDEQYFESFNRGYHEGAAATPISIEVLGSSNFTTKIQRELFDPVVSQAFCNIPPTTQYNMHVKKHIPVEDFPVTGLFPSSLNKKFSSSIFMPSMDRFITDSAKLKKLDEMLPILKAQDHRVLIYFQMTKMMDLMEEYLTFKQYNHIRLDGSSKLEDRRDLVHDWQTKPEIFIFLLSTRAGGLGINLTAADTVIFYDSDWNPTIDSQAMDRAHRLGQTRQVTVYRLLVRDTIEERMRDRAKQKEQVQQVVMEGKTQDNHVRTIEASTKIDEKPN
ncbi:chromatin-remodeling ATPase Ino80p [Monosporozyma servazzii]